MTLTLHFLIQVTPEDTKVDQSRVSCKLDDQEFAPCDESYDYKTYWSSILFSFTSW